MILTKEDLAQMAEEQRGKPCSCGVEEGEHICFVTKKRTPKGWSVRVVTSYRGKTGIWWCTVPSPIWKRTEEAADRTLARWVESEERYIEQRKAMRNNAA